MPCDGLTLINNGMDWLWDFQMRFDSHVILGKLKADKFHGSVTINFSDGMPHTCKVIQGLKAKSQPKQEESK